MRCSAVVVSVLACATLLLAACSHGEDPAAARVGPAAGPALTDGEFGGTGPGTLVSAERLTNIDLQLREKSSLAARIVYESTSGINDSHTLVTAAVFVPKGDPPPGGWKIIAFAHPATGIQTQCAPSASPDLLGSEPVITALLDAGYVVTATDYQGLGLRDTDHPGSNENIGPYNNYHPFLDSTTEGYNVIDSVRAARKLVPGTSENFVVFGSGQGGQAAWAANELATDYRGDLVLVGAVAISPTAALDWLADAAAGGTLTRDQQLTLQQYLAAVNKETGTGINLDDYRQGVVKDKWDVLAACWGTAFQDRAQIIGQIGPDDLRPDSDEATEVLRGFLQKTSLPQAPTAAPLLIVPDAPDGLIPADQTSAALSKACAMGDVLASSPPADRELPSLLGWVSDRFNGVAPPNDCPPVPAAPSP